MMVHRTGESAEAVIGHPAVSDASPFLWCCHARGPDDVHAAPDYETALAWSDMLNAINWNTRTGAPFSWNDCLIKAAPARWPHSAASHAEDLPRSIAGFALPEAKVES